MLRTVEISFEEISAECGERKPAVLGKAQGRFEIFAAGLDCLQDVRLCILW